jgi:hypothetical protein
MTKRKNVISVKMQDWEVLYHIHKFLPRVPILSQLNPYPLFPLGFPTKTLYMPVHSPICTTFPAHLILLDFITRTLLGDQYRSLSWLLCIFSLSHVTSSLLGPHILINTNLVVINHENYKFAFLYKV